MCGKDPNAGQFARGGTRCYNLARSFKINIRARDFPLGNEPFRSVLVAQFRGRVFVSHRSISQGKETHLSNYELTFVLRPVEEAALNTAQERIATQIHNAGGEIVARNDWGRRRLAYPIRKNNDGYYTTLYVTLPGSAVRNVERQLKLSDDILRFLFARVDDFVLPQAAAAPVEEAPAAEPVAEAPSAEAKTEVPAAPAEAAAENATATTAEG